MKPTHDVLIDLLSLERAGEASEDTKVLLNHYREHDPSFAQLARESESASPKPAIPEPHFKEKEMETFQQAQKALYVKAFVIVAVVFGFLAANMVAFAMFLLLD